MTHRWLAVLVFPIALTVPGCAMMPLHAGTTPRIELVENALVIGETRRGQVLEILGPPDGAGRSLLPMHPEPRAVWSYMEQDANWDEISLRYLLLFFDDQFLSGYLWYTAEDITGENQAPNWLRRETEK